MSKILISKAFVVNDGEVSVKDILIKGKRIEKIDNDIFEFNVKEIINAEGLYLFPGNKELNKKQLIYFLRLNNLVTNVILNGF